MIFTPLQPVKLELLDGSLMPMGHGRPVGRHLSTIVKAMKEAAGEKVTPIAGEDEAVRPLSGFLFERCIDLVWHGCPYWVAFEQAFKEYMTVARLQDDRESVLFQIRTSLNNILMSPDGLLPGVRLESYKATWRSMRKWEEDPEQYFWPWLTSEMAYLKAINTVGYEKGTGLSWRDETPVYTCRFFILWMNGDHSWRQGRGPQCTFTDVTFEPGEIEDNWRKVLKYDEYVTAKEAERKVS